MSCPVCGNDLNNSYDFLEGQLLLKCDKCETIWRYTTNKILKEGKIKRETAK
jgi:formate dehydrogenase maturation protein FdhE